jgi:hypothetical protein
MHAGRQYGAILSRFQAIAWRAESIRSDHQKLLNSLPVLHSGNSCLTISTASGAGTGYHNIRLMIRLSD